MERTMKLLSPVTKKTAKLKPVRIMQDEKHVTPGIQVEIDAVVNETAKLKTADSVDDFFKALGI